MDFSSTLNSNKFKSKPLAKALSLSVINQAVSSGSNFILGLYLVRILSPAEFGLYGIGFAVCMFYAGAGNALFLTQMTVHLPDKTPEEINNYIGRMLILVVIVCLCTLALSAVLLLITGFILKKSNSYSGFLSAVTVASVSYLLKDFFIRHAYNKSAELKALWINVVLSITMILSLVGLFITQIKLTSETALYVYAGAHLIAIGFGFTQSGISIRLYNLSDLGRDLAEAWWHGKWALLQNFVYWLRTQAYTYVCLVFIGIEAVGVINAARILISPVIFILPAVSQMMLPRLSANRKDHQQVLQQTKTVAAVLFMLAATYSLIILLNLNFAINMGLGKQYAQQEYITSIAIVWCVIMSIQVVQTCLGTLSQALKLFKKWASANFIGAVVSILFAAILCSLYGVVGSVLGTLSGEIVLLAIMWYQLFVLKSDCKTVNYAKS